MNISNVLHSFLAWKNFFLAYKCMVSRLEKFFSRLQMHGFPPGKIFFPPTNLMYHPGRVVGKGIWLSSYLKIGLASLFIVLILTACQTVSPTPTPAPPDEASPPARRDPSRPEASPVPSADLSPASPATSPTIFPSPTSLAPIEGGTAILGLVGQPESLNPVTENNSALRELSPLLFDTLLRVDPQTAQLQPGLAQDWEYTNDGRQVIFHLPPNLTWSNSASLTAADVADSLEATQHPALLAFSDIGARDDETLVLTFLDIDCAAVTTLAQLPLLPATEITATTPTGSGPFIVSEWSANKRTLNLVPNPVYHGSTSYLEGLTIRFLQEDDIPIALSEGQFDAIGPIQSLSRFKVPVSHFTDLVYPAPQVVYLAINFDPANGDPLSDEIRQALLLALDREAILAEALAGDGQLMAGSLLPDHWAADKALPLPGYDPAAARTLLTKAGLRDSDGDGWLDQYGERLELSIRLNGKNTLHQDLGWLISSYYRDLGLFARAESVPFDSVVDDLFTHDFTLAMFSWPILPNPDQRLYWHSTENTEGLGLNFTSYSNPELDALLDEAIAVPGCQPQDCAEIYTKAQRILAEDRPVDFLLAPDRHLLVAHRLHGLQPGPFMPFTWNVHKWYFETE
jgi:peptide/nickel transport system substrate-binding protein